MHYEKRQSAFLSTILLFFFIKVDDTIIDISLHLNNSIGVKSLQICSAVNVLREASTATLSLSSLIIFNNSVRFALQRKLQVRRGCATTSEGVSGCGSLGTKRFGPARLLHIRLPRRSCTCTRDLHGGIIVQTSNADVGTASLRTDVGGHGWRVPHPVVAVSSTYAMLCSTAHDTIPFILCLVSKDF